MLHVQTSDGTCQTYDLTDDADAQRLIRQLRSSEYQASIRAIQIKVNGTLCTLARPVGYSDPVFVPELVEGAGRVKGAERVICFAGESRITLTVHESGPARVSVARVGHQLYNPLLEDQKPCRSS